MHMNKKRIRFKMLAFLALLSLSVCAVPIAAQDSAQAKFSQSIPKSWFRIGVGGTRTYMLIGGGVFFRLSDPFSIGVRGGVAMELSVFIQPAEAFWELGPVVAYVPLVGSSGMVSLVVGTGLTGGIRRGEFLRHIALAGMEYKKVTFRTISFTAEVHGAFFISRSLGLSVALLGNVNRERSFAGYQIGLQFTQP